MSMLISRTATFYLLTMMLIVPFLTHAAEQKNKAQWSSLLDASIIELQEKLSKAEISSAQLVDFYLARIAAYDQTGPALNAISIINPGAQKRARELDEERSKRGARGPLHGIPMLIKDNYETTDMQTANGSKIFAGWLPPHDAEIVKRLRDAGAIILAKTNMHEMAMGFATHGSLFGQTLNPYALDRIPGGSSGGSGAGVAANFASAGFGSDTCGSIRMPSSFNSLVGLRSTVGLSSRRGIIPLSHSWDTGGPMTRTVSDIAVIYDVIAGYDPGDPKTAESIAHIPDSYTAFLNKDGLLNKRLGVLTDLLVVDPEDKEVAAIIRSAARVMESAGAEVVDITIPGLLELMADDMGGMKLILSDIKADINAFLTAHPSAPVQSIAEILQSEFMQDADLRGNLQAAEDFKSAPSLEYFSINAKRERISEAVHVAMAEAQVDALIYPTVRRQPALIGEWQHGTNCHLSGHIGFPAITVPAGFSKDGLPIGVEILARRWQEPLLIELAYAYEQATKHRRLPASTP